MCGLFMAGFIFFILMSPVLTDPEDSSLNPQKREIFGQILTWVLRHQMFSSVCAEPVLVGRLGLPILSARVGTCWAVGR